MELSAVIAVIGVLVALTNVIVQVAKKATWEKVPTNCLALIVAEVLTIGSGIAYFQIKSIPIVWHLIAALIIGGIMVAYASMFGFDKLQEAMNWRDAK